MLATRVDEGARSDATSSSGVSYTTDSIDAMCASVGVVVESAMGNEESEVSIQTSGDVNKLER